MIAGVAAWVWGQMRSIEDSAGECEPLIEALARMHAELGRYPDAEAASLPARLVERCHYQPIAYDHDYVLVAGDFGGQWYQYDSTTREWAWD